MSTNTGKGAVDPDGRDAVEWEKATVVECEPEARLSRRDAREMSLVLYCRDSARVVLLPSNSAITIGRSEPSTVVVNDETLSRQHARFWRGGEDECWVEDLDSTNGVWVNGSKVSKSSVHPGDRVSLGAIDASLYAPDPSSTTDLLRHAAFLQALEKEIVRARHFRRPLALMMVRGLETDAHVARFHDIVRQQLRPVDQVGMFAPDALELLLPEVGTDGAEGIATTLTRGESARLACGVAAFPDVASSAEGLIAEAHAAVRRATAASRIVLASPDDRPGPIEMIGGSPRTRALVDTVERLARTSLTVLVQGETGTGKEVVARAIHQLGPRSRGPFRTVNCGAVPRTLLESVFFGHERGSFTGAAQSTRGFFEQASGGTLFLDEIGELPVEAQAALLRVLETSKLTRVGGQCEVEVDVRVVAATHRNLENMVEAGTFRSDLLYRLNVMTVDVPPLRSRPEEIEPLVAHFLAEANRHNGRAIRGLTPAARAALAGYEWPGNVRELRNAIERAVVLARGDTITEEDLPDRVRAAHPPAKATTGTTSANADFKARIQAFETSLIAEALDASGGNQSEAARRLRMPLRTLVFKLKAYGLRG